MKGQLIPRGDRTWLVRVFEGRDAVTKRRRYRNQTVHGTKRDAQAALTKMQREIDTGTFVQATRETVGEYLHAWLDGAAKMSVRDQTWRSYRKLIVTYIVPTLGMRKLATLRLTDVDSLYADLSARGLSPRTVQYVHRVLRSALKKTAKREPRDVGQRVAYAFLAAAQHDRWHALWSLLVMTGLRPSEALALKWDDIGAGRVHVRRVLIQEPGGLWRFDEPKTARSARTITLPLVVTRALQQHRKRQAEERLLIGAAYDDNGLVFANEVGRPLEMRNLVRRHLARVLERGELPHLRLYDRHMAATILMENGEHPKVVSERMGHCTIKLTMDTYSHVTPTMQERTADRLDALFGNVADAR